MQSKSGLFGSSRGMLLAALPVLALVACQSKTAGDVLDPGGASSETKSASENPTSPAGSLPGSQTLGNGETRVSMLLPLSAGGAIGEKGRRMSDAAKLAMSDLGNQYITLSIQDTRGDSTVAKDLVVKAMAAGAKVIIGPVELDAAQRLTSISGPTRPPVLVLAENFSGAPSLYAMALNEADSAAAGAAAIAQKGKRKFVLFVAKGPIAGAIEKRVVNGLSITGASLALTVPFDPATGAEKAAADMLATVATPEGVVIAIGDASPLPILRALKAQGISPDKVAIVGTARWLEQPLADPLLQGVYVAALDKNETGPIADRFKATYGYAPDVNAIYAYDSVALTAGIAGAMGPKGFTRQVIENRNGFRGSTGVFHFRADGASERAMSLYRIEKGAARKVANSVSGY
ncbi:ABC transporter substrate-binding protein [Mesorhizobium retamae]|uniref:ABC transporter substrate-binding protein n=1 Tax=Mesorhizobium retamae TaxID=2912854 RepID=A0ABS9QIB9_9HYPH|nr:penicillin-binding protein activator [Mesorhizobium sp. IRAMC:0171]MCG7507136.1 ABC transporter substrate-binding protein [Mesorhizobium sp. IRAMC:0171]